MSNADQFAGWSKLLELAKQHKTKSALREAITAPGSGVQIIETEPLSGYYRCAAVKNGPLLPVAIWRDENGVLQILRANEPVKLERCWPYCAWNPISYEWYEAATERGEKWPDEAAMSVETTLPTIKAREHGCEECVMGSPIYVPCNKPATQVIDTGRPTEGPYRMCDSCAGHSIHNRGMKFLRAYEQPNPREHVGANQPPVEDEAQALKSQIEAAKGVAEKDYKDITTDDDAAAAQSLRSRLLTLSGDADKKREAEKKPHFEAAKKVDARWQPVVKLGKEAADWIRDRLSAYATKKANEEAEARRLQAIEDAKRLTEQPADEVTLASPLPPPPAVATQTTIKGASGRAATIRTVKIAKVVDYDKAYAHLKAIPEIKAAIDKVAQRMIDAGNEVPGVEINEGRRVA